MDNTIRKGKWYLQPEDLNNDLPPDQLYTSATTQYFNQGRRRITTEQTHHEDILKQPVLEVLTAKLIKANGSYAIVGEIQNIDNIPADVTLKGTLYNDANKMLATYNAKYLVKHKLLPKETSGFRINFEGIAWTKTKDSIPNTFNPDQFTPIEFEEQPTKFNLQVAGNVSGNDLFKNAVVSQITVDNTNISGNIFNSGIQEITIPQLLISYYNANKELVWVDHHFIKEGIRQQRQQHFNYPLLDHFNYTIINQSMDNIFVNGLPNTSIAKKIVPNRIKNHTTTHFQKVNNTNFKFIKIETNTYVGNPN